MPRVEERKTLGLDSRLVHDLLRAGLRCPTFTGRQKAALCHAANDMDKYKTMTDIVKYWPFDTLSRKPNSSDQEIMVSPDSSNSIYRPY